MNLFKRNPHPDAPYTCRFMVRGKVHSWSTKTNDKKLAEKRAKDYREKIIAGAFNLVDGMKARNGIATFAEVFAAYNGLPTPNAHTKKRNVAAMKIVLAASKLDETAQVDRLGAGLVIAYQSAVKAANPGNNSALVSANSNIRMARSIFSKAAVRAYRITLNAPKEPVLDFFDTAFFRVTKPTKALPTPEAMAAAVAKLKAMSDQNYYRAFILAACAGLRASEIRAARRSWIDGTTLRIGAFPDEFKPKSGQMREVNIEQSVADVLLQGDDPVYLVGQRRGPIVATELNAILRECGFGMDKPLHALRRRFGSLLYSNQSAAIAKETLGHSSIQVTERHYASSLNKQAPVAMPG